MERESGARRNPIEAFRSARKRINPEGLAFSAAVTASSYAVLPIANAGTTFGVYELIQHTENPTLMKILGITAILILNAVSTLTETKVLKKDNYSASPVASTMNVLTGKPLLSSVGGHIVNNTIILLANPINLAALATKNTELFAASEGSAALVLAAWFLTFNTLILKDKTKPFVEGVKKVREETLSKVSKRLRKKYH